MYFRLGGGGLCCVLDIISLPCITGIMSLVTLGPCMTSREFPKWRAACSRATREDKIVLKATMALLK